MKTLISTGLPSVPTGVDDRTFTFLAPLHRAISALEQQLGVATGRVSLSKADAQNLSQVFLHQVNNISKLTVLATETVNPGMAVNLFESAGKLACRKADCLTGLPAHAFVGGTSSVVVGDYVEVITSGLCPSVAGTTVGVFYWLSSAGLIQPVKPTAPGVVRQSVAVGCGSYGVLFNFCPPLD